MTGPAPRSLGDPVLSARGVTVHFGAVTALRDVDFEVHPGRVHALVGENGAGKSTLMRVLSGALVPGAGRVEIDGAAATFGSPRDAHRAGIRMIHQELSLAAGLSVAENIFLGAEPSRHGLLDRETMRAGARATLAALGEDIDPDAQVGVLPLARREMVEIAKALTAPVVSGPGSALLDTGDLEHPHPRLPGQPSLASGLRVLILDEPTAILSARETSALFARIALLARAGVGIVYCSHRLDEIDVLADDVTVLRDGARVAQVPARTMSRDTLIHLMVGRGISGARRARAREAEPPEHAIPALRVDGLAAPGVRDVSFILAAGEIVALVGLVGAGRTELARALIGVTQRTGGEVQVDGVPVAPRSPGDAIAAGIAYVSEDRKAGALIPLGSVGTNMTLARLPMFARRSGMPIIDRARERSCVRLWIDKLRIKADSADDPVSRLSGGNQQKVVLARWLIEGDRPLRALIVDEPTRGVDVGARAEIYDLLGDLTARGTAVLAITSDLEEALDIADRLLVMREGRIVGDIARASATATSIAMLMVPA